jgi:hypothetical protein
MTDDRPMTIARRIRALTGLPTVIEATESGWADEVLWLLRRRAADFCAAGRPSEAIAEACAARAWERALRAGEAAPWTDAGAGGLPPVSGDPGTGSP